MTETFDMSKLEKAWMKSLGKWFLMVGLVLAAALCLWIWAIGMMA